MLRRTLNVYAILLALAPLPARAQCTDSAIDFVGESFGYEFGASLADIGDFNDDGVHDIAVGAPAATVGGEDAGAAYLFLGGFAPDDVADLRFYGAAGARLGFALSTAGDFNADGVDDFILCSPGLNDGAGVAEIFFGSSTPENVQDITLSAVDPGDAFGYAVTSIGDFDGDTYDDIAVAAPLHDHIVGGTDAGRVLLYYGEPGGTDIPLTILRGESPGDEFGTSLAAGDVDGDGQGDLVVSAPRNAAGGADAGRVYVFFGDESHVGHTMSAADADVVLTGQFGEFFGRTVAVVGDVNDDGFGDVCVVAPTDPSTPPGGNAYVYLGGPSMDAVADLTIPIGETTNTRPHGVSHAGDVNNDDVDDFLVGAAVDAAARGITELAYVFYGGTGVDASPDLTIMGEQGAFPSAAAHVDNFLLNTRAEILTGAYATPLGRADLWEISDCNGNGIVDVCDIENGDLFDCNGNGLADACDIQEGAPDCNANGVPDDCDLASGTSADCNGNLLPDECDVQDVQADCNLDGVPDVCEFGVAFAFDGTTSGQQLGISVALAGDYDGDTFDDVLVGSFLAGPGGRAYVHLGGPSADETADFTFDGSGSASWFGAALAGGSDFNGDGHVDAVVGAPRDDAGPVDGGRAYVFYGGPSADDVADVTLTHFEGPEAHAGTSLAMGDVDGDQVADVIVGAPGNLQAGKVLVYLGGDHPSGAMLTPDNSIVGRGGQDRFGVALACLDMNGDEIADVAVGSYPADQGPGLVDVFFGGTPMGAADVTLFASQPDDHFGEAVARAGDVDDDGFDDLLVGAPYSDSNGHDAGRAYLFLGGLPPDNVADLEVSPPLFAADRHLGVAVAGAGDMNGDGHDDIVLGEDGGTTFTGPGRAYVYFGGVGGVDVTVDRILVGIEDGDQFGHALSPAGDFDVDGNRNLLAGLPRFDGAIGRAQVLDVAMSGLEDCNGNGVGDACDIASGESMDGNGNGIPDECEPVAVTPPTPPGAHLLRVHPNPFSPETTIRFELVDTGHTKIVVLDVQGRRVRTLLDREAGAGAHAIAWRGDRDDGAPLAAGVYYLVLESGGVRSTRTVTRLE